MFEAGLFREEKVVRCEFGAASLKTLGPMIILTVLNFEVSLDTPSFIVRDDLCFRELGVFADKLLFLNVFRL